MQLWLILWGMGQLKEQAERINSKLVAAVAASAEAGSDFHDSKQVNAQLIHMVEPVANGPIPAPHTWSCTCKNVAVY